MGTLFWILILALLFLLTGWTNFKQSFEGSLSGYWIYNHGIELPQYGLDFEIEYNLSDVTKQRRERKAKSQSSTSNCPHETVQLDSLKEGALGTGPYMFMI